MLLARMNAELAMGDAVLKKAGTANVFTVFGEPDVQIDRTGDDVVIRLRGVDVYDPHHRRHPQQRHRQNRPLDDRHRLRRGMILRPALLLRRRRQRPLSATQALDPGHAHACNRPSPEVSGGDQCARGGKGTRPCLISAVHEMMEGAVCDGPQS